MIIKKFELFLEKVILSKTSNSGSTKQNDTILDKPSNNQSLSSLLLLNNKLKKEEYSQLIKDLELRVSKKFVRTLLNSDYSEGHIERVILSLNNSQFIVDKQKIGDLICEYCGKTPLLKNKINLLDIMKLKMPMRINPNSIATCDHKEPKSKGGSIYDYSNLAVCCHRCNGIKGDMSYDDWKYLMEVANKLIIDLDLNKNNFDIIKKSELFNSIESSDLRKRIKEFIINKVNNKQNLIKESKQVGFLYHFTDTDGLLSILSDNILKTYHDYDMKKDFVSFTRNKNYLNEPGSKGKSFQLVRLTIDGDKLSNHYKISPKHNIHRSISKTPHGTGSYNKDEFEEVCFKPIKNIKDYIISIDIDKTALIRYFTFGYITTNTDDIKNMFEKAEKKGFKDFVEFKLKLDSLGIHYNFIVLNKSLNKDD